MHLNNKRIVSDPIFLPLLIFLLLDVIGGRYIWQKIAEAANLGPGWPELLQGISGFLLLALLLVRSLKFKKRRESEVSS
ncbi:hypothetical protein K4W92_00225 [Pseudomonas aeruginosa]|uniref:hypothetical protein n=1 Tax=Pseudomonas aeruginosa TaxID=287 RepID=UPI001E40D7A3|nr:hypothetical protein [Pseudomonas aeruginosa]MCD2844863.1 hypothetical protein [Pseudomonas aeruginosa]